MNVTRPNHVFCFTGKYMKRAAAAVCGAMLLCVSGCGDLKSDKALVSIAQKRYGDCELIKYTETERSHTARVRDRLQDFEYSVTSSYSDINIDGAYFGSAESVSDTFTESLQAKVTELAAPGLEKALGGAKYSISDTNNAEPFLVIYTSSEENAGSLALSAAEEVNRYNAEHRLDGKMIYAVSADSDKWYHNKHYGSVVLPEMVFLTPEDENGAYYTEMAQLQTDKNAKFVRKAKGVFSDTGADLSKVVCVLGTDYPTEMNSPVTFYYFTDSSGREYYLCDFNYYGDNGSFAWYTNY